MLFNVSNSILTEILKCDYRVMRNYIHPLTVERKKHYIEEK